MVESSDRTEAARRIAQSAAARLSHLADAMNEESMDLTFGNDVIAALRNDLTAIEVNIAERRARAALGQHWSEKAERGAGYIIGRGENGLDVTGRTGINMHVHDWERVMTKDRLMPMLRRLAASVDGFGLWEPEQFEAADVDASAIIIEACGRIAGQHAAVAMVGASPTQMRAIIDHAKTCADCRDVTVIWVDIRDHGSATDVDLEVEFGYVLQLDERNGTFILGGLAGPGVAVDLAA